VRLEPREAFPADIEIGMQFVGSPVDGSEEMLYTVTDISEEKVVVDGNHPMRDRRCTSSARLPTCARRRRTRSNIVMRTALTATTIIDLSGKGRQAVKIPGYPVFCDSLIKTTDENHLPRL